MENQLNWAQFEVSNINVHVSFENLCRNLFKRQFFSNDTIFRSNPNHAGTEIDPLFSDVTSSKISFQAKFLSKNDYSQIKKSTDKVINTYKDKLDTLYFYCNRDLDINSDGFLRIKNSLNEANIEIELITNKEILDQVIIYKDLYSYYFKKHSLDRKWFEENSNKVIFNLGPRYNSDLNEKTEAEMSIKLFTKDEEAIFSINNKKKLLEDYLLDLDRNINENDKSILIGEIINAISGIEDINYYNIEESLQWANCLKDKFTNSMKNIENELLIINDKKDKLYGEFKKSGLEQEYYSELNKLDYKSRNLEKILYFYKELESTNDEKALIKSKMLILTGKAGTGKSHLLGTTNKKIIDNNDYSVLILGHTFINNNAVSKQIMENLGLNYNFIEFLDVLEAIGSDKNQEVYIFIDAINESKYKEIWKNGLSNLYSAIIKRKFIKLIVSIKNGYENYVLDEYIKSKIKNNQISKVEHFGFSANSIEVMHNFFNYYNITFSPSDFLSYELTNPLFLTLYCKVYSEGQMNISELFKNIIDKTYLEIKERLNLEEDKNILIDLLMEMASVLYKNNDMSISRKDLYSLNYWSLYGVRAIDIVPILLKNGIFIDFSNYNEEYYSFSYNLLGDYLQAKYVVSECKNINDIFDAINYLLQIADGKIKNFNNLDFFNFVCALSFDKFKIDPINEILSQLTDEYSKNSLLDKYIEGQSLRNSDNIDIQSFKQVIKNNPINTETLFNLLIENSLKTDNDLNSNFLHKLLFKLDLNERDSIWTVFVNQLSFDGIRIYQIIQYVLEGKNIEKLNIEELKLLLTLLSWLLTSSNRYLRDETSKALIEILKNSYKLCEDILRKFEGVNDPYVLQRLYGCVFGACTKNFTKKEQEFKVLAEYVYESVFNQEMVYPDILLRDYARLIIEKYLFLYSNDDTLIKIEKIFPPYKSEEIPTVLEKEYYDKTSNENNGINRIDFSMRPDIKGVGYGDFGRYVFQSALNYFKDIDILNLYHYTMQYIIDNLGYTNELFGINDNNIGYYYRHDTRKSERIGKKYQWIAFYNILARISDKCSLKDDYGENREFIGAWNPYVRDFDPTINMKLIYPKVLKPKFTINNNEEFISEEENDNNKIRKWKNIEANMFQESLIQVDNDSREWVVLYNFKDAQSKPEIKTKEKDYNRSGAQRIWRISQGYFIKQEQFDKLKKSLNNKNFLGRWFPEGYGSVYYLFNREYYWSSGYKDTFTKEWLEYYQKTGERKIIQREGNVPIIDEYTISFKYKQWEEKNELEEKVAEILPSFHNYLWEEQFDASQEDTTSFYIPCSKLVESLKIQQKIYDKYFYNDKDELIIFDSIDSKSSNRFLIRKDYLDKFLEENNYILFWTNMGEKRFNVGLHDQIYSEWSGLNWYSKGEYHGEMSVHDF